MDVIDLFSGCGGLSLGFEQAGFFVKKAVEFDPKIAQNYVINHPGVHMLVDDIRNLDQTGEFQKGDAQVIIGGPPCQGFSMAGARIREGFIDDPRNYLFKHYFNVVKTVKPQIFVMENVKGILTMQKGQIFEEIKRLFQDGVLLDGKPYRLYNRVVKAAQFGIPQKRERVILIGTTLETADMDTLWQKTREEIQIEFPDYFNMVTVEDAIGNMPPATEDGIVPNPVPRTDYQRFLASRGDTLANHAKPVHSPLAIDRMSRVGSGENFTALEEKINSVHSGAYGRLCWSEPAPTITTRFDTPAGGRFIHPTENRTLTPREAARIQSFPDDFVFCGNRTTICKTIGNAVPPKISYFLARLVRNMIGTQEGYYDSYSM